MTMTARATTVRKRMPVTAGKLNSVAHFAAGNMENRTVKTVIRGTFKEGTNANDP